MFSLASAFMCAIRHYGQKPTKTFIAGAVACSFLPLAGKVLGKVPGGAAGRIVALAALAVAGRGVKGSMREGAGRPGAVPAGVVERGSGEANDSGSGGSGSGSGDGGAVSMS